MNNSVSLRLVLIALIAAIAFLGYLQYQSMTREAKIYETLQIVQLHVESLDDLHRIQQIEIDGIKKEMASSPFSDASDSLSSGIETMLNTIEEKIATIRSELSDNDS
jgi:hypothetical protein